MSSEAVLDLQNVSKTFYVGLVRRTPIRAVDRVSMEVRSGEILGILGESGSGKSTIAKLILKVYKPTSGSITYRGRDIWRGMSDREYYSHVQGVFQDPFASFNPRRKVLDTLRDALKNFYPSDQSVWDERLTEAIEKVGLNLAEAVGKYPHEFSGGQLQRLSIARALLVRPEVIIADEPVSMVDASTRIDILDIFIDLRDSERMASVVIGHDLSLTYYVSDRVVVLYKGQVVEQGQVDILKDPSHPYTKTLLEAVPQIDRRWDKPLLSSYNETREDSASKCVFWNRCPFRMEICAREEPPTVSLGKAEVRCWLYVSR